MVDAAMIGRGWAVMECKKWIHFLSHRFGKKGDMQERLQTVDTDEYKIAATRPKSIMKQDSEGKSLTPYGLQIQGYKMTALTILSHGIALHVGIH